jgi:Skp family chaperone for outer membrane proteins
VARVDEFLETGWLQKLTDLGQHPGSEDHLNMKAQEAINKEQANIKEEPMVNVVKQQPVTSKKRRRAKKEEEEVKPSLVTQIVKCARCGKDSDAPASLCPLPDT